MLRKILLVAATTVAVTAAVSAPAYAEFETTVGTPRCNVTTTGPTFKVTTLPNPGVTPSGSLGASVNCPLF